MPNKIETKIRHDHDIEAHMAPDGIAIETYAGGEIKVHTGNHPKTLINLPEFNAHINIHRFGPFEFNKEFEPDEVLVRREHHRSMLAIAFSDRKGGGPYEYDVWSPKGLIGFAAGKRLDLLIASFFYNDPNLDKFIKDAFMANNVQTYLKHLLITPE